MKEKNSLFGLRGIILGGKGLEQGFVKNKARRLMAEQAGNFYPAQQEVASQVSRAYQGLAPNAKAALQKSKLVQSGVSPQAAMTLASWGRKSGETLGSAARRQSGVQLRSSTMGTPQQAITTMARAPRAMAKAGSVYTPFSMLEELTKLCAAEVTEQEAAAALKRLQELEATKPTSAQVARGAASGALVAPAATFANKLVGGGVGKGISEAVKAPGIKGKLLGLGGATLGGGRQLLAASAGSAIGFGTVPLVRGYLDREAEKEKLKKYLGTSRRGKLRGNIKSHLGV